MTRDLLVNEVKNKGSIRLNHVMYINGAYNHDTIIRLYFNDWTLIKKMKGFGKKSHAELKEILNNMKVRI